MTEERGEVFLTGASGFVGSHVLAALLAAGFSVRALRRPTSRPLPTLPGCRVVVGDVRRAGHLVRQMAGCRYLVHVAALYSFSPRCRQEAAVTNVQGCEAVLAAAHLAGIERAVVTSSSATVGPEREGRPAREQDWADEPVSAHDYHGSKVRQERVALAARVPAVLLLPTAPVGPGDWKPTPTGKMVVDFMRGRMFASLAGGLNVVPVEDVAAAHLAALRQGRPGERYLLGGENVSFQSLWEMLAQVCGRRAPVHRLPYGVALALARADEIRCRLTGVDTPEIPLEGVRMARHPMFVTCEKAHTELAYRPGSVRDALERAVRWYRDHGYAG